MQNHIFKRNIYVLRIALLKSKKLIFPKQNNGESKITIAVQTTLAKIKSPWHHPLASKCKHVIQEVYFGKIHPDTNY